MRHVESHTQKNCVTWFRLQYPKIGKLLFAIPNGGFRNTREAGIMKGEGVTAGISDLILLYPSNGLASLCIEFKSESGRQSPAQKEWQELIERNGSRYIICHTFDEFRVQVDSYLGRK